VTKPKPKAGADLGQVRKDLAREPYRLATCGWCGFKGQPITEVEFIQTGGGERKRCVDRDACRERVDGARRVRYGPNLEMLRP
jgi:hypothetical protein